MTEHTKGPWYPGHLGSDSSCQCRSIVDDGKYMGAIASVHVGNGLPIGEGGNDAPPADEAAANMKLIAAAPELLDMLKAIKQHGELACVDAHLGSYFTGGKKPATKDVFQFPRHMLTELDAAIAKATA